jgi:2-iminobutanoate/2-iminopropanoate deaminase
MQRREFNRLAAVTALVAATPGCLRRSPMRSKPIAPEPGNAYAHAVEVSGFQQLLFISGQVPEDPDGNIPADFPGQYRLAWRNVEARLRAADMTFDNLVKATIFLSDRRYVKESAGLRAQVLGERTPAITIILTGIYHEAWLLEIEAIAAA